MIDSLATGKKFTLVGHKIRRLNTCGPMLHLIYAAHPLCGTLGIPCPVEEIIIIIKVHVFVATATQIKILHILDSRLRGFCLEEGEGVSDKVDKGMGLLLFEVLVGWGCRVGLQVVVLRLPRINT
jgi:hypothetical protein